MLASLGCQVAAEITATETPLPSETPTDTATPLPTDTATPEPTLDRTATAEARATSQAGEALAIIQPALEDLGFSASQGGLAYFDFDLNEQIIATNAYSTIFQPINEGVEYENFIFSIDVTWDSETGLAGCGLIFRSEPDLRRGRQAQFTAIRLSGLPAWYLDLYEYGQFQADLLGRFLTNGAIRQGADSTNTYVIVAEGTSVSVYANGTRLGGSTLPSGMTSGAFGAFTTQESGRTTCTFSNLWIWELP